MTTEKKTMKLKIILISLLITTSAFGQLGTPLSQYSGNQLLFNPAVAGLGDALAVNLSVRRQWVQLPGAPSLLSLNAHLPMRNQRHGLGVIIQREEWGPMVGNFVYFNYAYHIQIHGNILSLGVQAGLYNNVINWNRIGHVRDPDDPTLGQGREGHTNFDANLGIFWVTRGYYFGFSVKHLAPPRLNFEQDIPTNDQWHPHPTTQFFLMSGYEISLRNRDFTLRPEWFMRYAHGTPLAVNLGLHVVYRNRFFVGTNVQTGQRMLSFSARGFITDNIRLGYSYNLYFGPIRSAQLGTHEISLSYLHNNIWEPPQRHRRPQQHRRPPNRQRWR